MKHLKNNPVTGKYLVTAGSLFMTLLIVATFFFTGCKKDLPHSKEIIVHCGSSIQAAVDAAETGTTIKIEPCVYEEAVTINKKNITLIGLKGGKDEEVIIQNPGDEKNGITVLENGDGIIIKNVTVKNFEENGVYLNHADNFLLSHVVTINNGDYGLFPEFCKNGVVEHCSATGHNDVGIFIGQSENITLEHNVAFANVNGLEIQNSTDVTVSKNKSYDNVSGILVILLPGRNIKTSANILVSKNHVYDNNHINFAEPGSLEAFLPVGSGILVVGVDNVTVEDNKINDNNFVGVATVSTLILGALAGLPPEAFADIEPNPDGAKIISNKLSNNGAAPPAGLPLPGVDLLWDGSGTNNCWKNNNYSTSYPSPLPACS